MNFQRHYNWLLIVAAALLLAVGCGGPAGTSDQPPSEPTTAAANPDPPPPVTLVITSPLQDGLYNQAGPVLSFTATDPDGNAIPTERLQAFVHDGVDGEFTATRAVTDLQDGANLPDSPDGQHSLEFKVFDQDAVLLVDLFISFRTDTLAPGIVVTAPSSVFVITDPTPLLEYTIDEPCFDQETGVSACNESVLLDGNEIPTRTGEALPALSDAVHELQILLADEAGNVTSVTHSFTVDATPPTVTVPPPPAEPPPGEPPPTNDPIQDNGTVGTEDGDLTVSSDENAEAAIYLDPSSACHDAVALGDPDGLCAAYVVENVTIQEDETVTVPIENIGSLALGEHILLIVAADEVGNVSVTEVHFTVSDPEAPQIVVTSADGLLPTETVVVGAGNSKSFPLVFAVTDDHATPGELTVTVGVELWDTSAGVQGAWSPATGYSFDAAAGSLTVKGDGDSNDSDGQSSNGDGTYRVTVSAMDGALNTTMVSLVVTVDTTAPDVVIDSPVGPDPLLTGKPPLEVASSEEAAFDVQIFLFEGPLRPVTDDDLLLIPIDGNLQQNSGAPLTDGQYTVVVQITDAAGNTGSGSSTFTVDAAGPMVTITAPVDGQTISSDTVLLSYEAKEADKIEALLSSAAYPDSPVLVPLRTINPVEHTLQAYEEEINLLVHGEPIIPDGDYTIQLVASDSTSPQPPAESEPVTVHLNTTAPAVTLDSPSGDAVFFNPGDSIPVEFTATRALSMFVKLDGETVQSYGGTGIGTVTHSLQVTAPDGIGAHEIEVAVYDGNDDQATATTTVYVNGTAPVVTIHSPQDGHTYHNDSITLHYTIETENEIASETVWLNGEEMDLDSLRHHHYHLWWWWNRHHHGHHSDGHEHHNGHHFHLRDLDDGDYTLAVQAVDEAGNASEVSEVSFTIQTHHHGRDRKTSCFFDHNQSWKKVVKCLSKKTWDDD